MKNFKDLQRLGMTEPTVHQYLRFLGNGDMSKEEALIGMVMTLVDQKREVTDNYIEHMERCTTPRMHI